MGNIPRYDPWISHVPSLWWWWIPDNLCLTFRLCTADCCLLIPWCYLPTFHCLSLACLICSLKRGYCFLIWPSWLYRFMSRNIWKKWRKKSLYGLKNKWWSHARKWWKLNFINDIRRRHPIVFGHIVRTNKLEKQSKSWQTLTEIKGREWQRDKCLDIVATLHNHDKNTDRVQFSGDRLQYRIKVKVFEGCSTGPRLTAIFEKKWL